MKIHFKANYSFEKQPWEAKLTPVLKGLQPIVKDTKFISNIGGLQISSKTPWDFWLGLRLSVLGDLTQDSIHCCVANNGRSSQQVMPLATILKCLGFIGICCSVLVYYERSVPVRLKFSMSPRIAFSTPSSCASHLNSGLTNVKTTPSSSLRSSELHPPHFQCQN